ncbi:hypothetical protein JOQ06_012798 [Pogonophryne albipinna]|uniref:Uncharacterized protein n=1 Tax=Pogonophryne albipinna TaxID=1090488 RepID=A0AAD6BL78_9TELE|nr:hypothetical protein JOQ06_012798 [Pogonophryne albipinna]
MPERKAGPLAPSHSFPLPSFHCLLLSLKPCPSLLSRSLLPPPPPNIFPLHSLAPTSPSSASPLRKLLKPLSLFPAFRYLARTSSHTKYRAASDEEEREEVLVQSAMQMATENMSTSQSGTRTASFCQFIHNKSNATP